MCLLDSKLRAKKKLYASDKLNEPSAETVGLECVASEVLKDNFLNFFSIRHDRNAP